jgi:para-aminobenzoate synthetase / 4-amino-4-deoxychorismate lyase
MGRDGQYRNLISLLLMSKEKPGTNEVLIQDSRQGLWMRFRNPLRIYSAYQVDEVVPLLHSIEEAVESEGLTAAGFVSYEAAAAFDSSHVTRPAEKDFPLAWFGLYEKSEVFLLPPCETADPAEAWYPSISKESYSGVIKKVRDYIAAGDTYQVNFSFRLRTKMNIDPWQLFLQMASGKAPGYGAYVETNEWAVCSASPELFFQLQGENLVSRPMKGTLHRGRWMEEDQEQVKELRASAKDQAENLMIVDMVRSDLGRIAKTGSVTVERMFEVEKYPTLLQLTSTVRCKTESGLVDIFNALFPPASITGAPKIRTMQIISELEDSPRQIYTGTIGYLAPEKNARFNVAIRTALLNKSYGFAEYGVGGGIVWDSTEQSELEECYVKAAVLTRKFPEFELLESVLWNPDSGCPFLERHLDRLEASAAYFSRKFNKATTRNKIRELSAGLGNISHKIRLLLGGDRADVRLETQPLEKLPHPYRVCCSPDPVDSSDFFLFHKTTHREIYIKARQACPEFDDVLLWNEKGEITESTIANIFVELDGQLYTPPINSGLLPGIFRATLLENRTVTARIIRRGDLTRSTRIYLANSVRGLWEVAFMETSAK